MLTLRIASLRLRLRLRGRTPKISLFFSTLTSLKLAFPY
jgi:hypothetical protein